MLCDLCKLEIKRRHQIKSLVKRGRGTKEYLMANYGRNAKHLEGIFKRKMELWSSNDLVCEPNFYNCTKHKKAR
jgi:hypothetical protein